MKRLLAIVAGAALALGGLTACDDDATIVNENLSREADNFKVLRRVVFYNAIKGETILTTEGYCSVEITADQMKTVCKSGNTYFRNALGRSDNVLWFYQQMDQSNVSPTHYKFIVKPGQVIPNFEVR